MTPARQTVTNLGDLLGEGDVVVDGGHSRWTDDQAQAALQASGIRVYGIAAPPAPGVRAVSDSPLLPCVAIPPVALAARRSECHGSHHELQRSRWMQWLLCRPRRIDGTTFHVSPFGLRPSSIVTLCTGHQSAQPTGPQA